MRPAMPGCLAGLCTLFLVLIAGYAASQSPFPTPPEPLDKQSQPKEQPTTRIRVDGAQLQKDADALARMAQTIPVDVASVRRGMLPKDVIVKLKQIEKLSKQLRTELNP